MSVSLSLSDCLSVGGPGGGAGPHWLRARLRTPQLAALPARYVNQPCCVSKYSLAAACFPTLIRFKTKYAARRLKKHLLWKIVLFSFFHAA